MERNINEGMKVVNMKKVTSVHGLFIVAFAVLANMIQFIGAEKVGKDGASIYNVNSMAYYAGQIIFVVAVLAVNIHMHAQLKKSRLEAGGLSTVTIIAETGIIMIILEFIASSIARVDGTYLYHPTFYWPAITMIITLVNSFIICREAKNDFRIESYDKVVIPVPNNGLPRLQLEYYKNELNNR